jgi:hypothetical protein
VTHQQREQEVGEEEGRQMVCLKSHLNMILAGLPGLLTTGAPADPGIIKEHVDTLVAVGNIFGQSANVFKRGKVRHISLQLVAIGFNFYVR